MTSDEIGNKKSDEDVDVFCISSREYLPREKCTLTSWNNDIRIRIQYELTNILPILFLSKDKALISESQTKFQKIVFELLSSVLYYTDILSLTAIEFLENCSIVSYLKICKILRYDFVGKEDLDVQKIPTDSIKDEFKNIISNMENVTEENLPSFKTFVEKCMSPLIMDTIWLLQMGYNDHHTGKSCIWLEFMTRLCRGNITSKERPLPSIPKSVKLINIKHIVSYLDLGKTDHMKITESLISPKYKLQQKYVRERTRICFTVDSYVTQRECLKGFSILTIVIKSFFDRLLFHPNLSYEDLFSDNITLYNKENVSLISHSNFECKIGCNDLNKKDLISVSDIIGIKSLWNIIVRYDLSIQRTIGIIFEVFISFISDLYEKKGMENLHDHRIFVLLEKLLKLFPKKIVTKSYLIFIEYISDIYKSFKGNFFRTEYTTELNIGNEKYRNIPWLIIDRDEIRKILDIPFFLLSSFLIKKKWFEFNFRFREKLLEWDQMYWLDYNSVKQNSEEQISEYSNERSYTFKYIPFITLENVKNIYQYYQTIFNFQINNNQFQRNQHLENLLKEILIFQGINIEEISFSDVSLIISNFLNFPSILFANAHFIDIVPEEQTFDENSETFYVSEISNNFEMLQEITDNTSMPFTMMNLSSSILRVKLKKIVSSFKKRISKNKNDSNNVIILYKSFHILINWIEQYCKYYFFLKNSDFIPIILEALGLFVKKDILLQNSFRESKHKLDGFKTPFELLHDILVGIIFPAVSFLPSNPSVPEMLNNSIFNELNLVNRYKIYRRLITTSYNKYPMNFQWMTVKKSLSRYLKAVTKDIIMNKTDSRNSNNTVKKPPTSIRVLISNIVSLCYTNPLAVCDSIVNQCNIYDNMIPLLIEVLGSNIDDICFDVMIFTIINFILSRTTSNINDKSNKELNSFKMGLRGIAKFTALLFTRRKVPRDILINFLRTIMYRIDETFHASEYITNIPNNFLDMVFWKQLLETLLSTPILDLSVLTEKQIKSLGGGPLLFQLLLSERENNIFETNIENSWFNSLLEVNSPARQTRDLFISILTKNEIQSKEILYRIAKLRSEILWNSPSNSNMDIKLLVNLSDEIHWCCIQTIEFLTRSFDIQIYKSSILNISGEKNNFEEIITQTFFYLDIPTAWSFLRSGIRKNQLDNTKFNDSETSEDIIFDIDDEILLCLRSYILKENQKKKFYSDEIWMDLYISFWYLDLNDINIPHEEYSTKLFEIYNDIYSCRESIDRIIAQYSSIDVKTENKMEKLTLNSFTNLQNIKTITNYSKNKNLLSRQARDYLKPHEKRFKKLTSFYNLLTEECHRYLQRNNYIIQFLNSMRGIDRFRNYLNDYLKEKINLELSSEDFIDSFILWICKDFIATRVLHSEKDAIFSYKWVERVLLNLENGLFSFNKEIIKLFLIILCKLISSLIRSSTPRESQLLGLFFNLIFSYIKNLHLNEISEIKMRMPTLTKELDEIQESDNFKISSEKVEINSLNFVYQCEKNMITSLSLGLGLLREKPFELNPEWIDTLSSVWLLLRCYESFPVSKLTGEYLLRILPNILEYATSKQWNDLNLSLTSLILKLKQRRANWIDARFDNENKKIKKEFNQNEISNIPIKKKTSTVTIDDRNRTYSSHNDLKRQRICTSSSSYKNYSKPSNLGRREELRKR